MRRWAWMETLAAVAVFVAAPAAHAQTALTRGVAATGLSGAVGSTRDYTLVVPATREVPRTLTGKKLEVPVKKLLLGQPAEKVAHRDAMANPASLDWFIDFARQRAAATAKE